jgi:D-alanyl-D-alanine carboxypeptidase
LENFGKIDAVNRWPTQRECKAFYGDPSQNNERWQRENLVVITPPFKLYYEGQPVRGVRIHRKCASSLALIFAAIWQVYNQDQVALDGTGFTRYSGGYCYRSIRGGRQLSVHSFAAALDFDAAHNGQTFNRAAGLLKADSPIVTIFEAEGWTWGGRWKGKRDPMHFQAARVA